MLELFKVLHQTQENERQIVDLKNRAIEKGWNVQRVFQEKASGTINSDERPAFRSMLKYLDEQNIKIVMVAEVSRIGRKVLYVLTTVDILHKRQIGIYIKPFDLLTYKNEEENPMGKMLLQMFALGAEMENDLRRQRKKEGIAKAKIRGKYKGRRNGAKADPADLLNKYQDVTDLLKKSDLSLRRIAQITNHSINTIRKVNALVSYNVFDPN